MLFGKKAEEYNKAFIENYKSGKKVTPESLKEFHTDFMSKRVKGGSAKGFYHDVSNKC
jgi:hypothetical protein